MALAGADMLLYPTAIGWNPDDDSVMRGKQRQSWITIQQSHAIANGIPVFACNRTGYEADQSGQTTGIEFWGSSIGIGQYGELLVTGSATEAAVIIAEINLEDTKRHRHTWPFLRDRRIDAYSEILLRFRDK
jgi:N-carbamoylputrescine amidase